MDKEGDPELSSVLYNLLEILRFAMVMISPFMPTTAEKMANQLGIVLDDYSLDIKWGGMKEGGTINRGEPLFPRLME
jgi:methionyl-tRNA synthetase